MCVGIPYAVSPIYRFPDAKSFSGTHLYNPYAVTSQQWQRANFHAHSRAWIGITNGAQSKTEIIERYRSLGYTVPSVSDYQHIAAKDGIDTFPAYEHGYNLVKQHQLVIGAHDVEWFDFLLWQSFSHQQYIIDRVKRKADLVAIAHPSTRDAYSVESLQKLTGYDLLEIANGSHTVPELWDVVLTSGRPVWVIGDDDTHDLLDPKRTAAGWTMIGAPSAKAADVIEALRVGRHYAVARRGAVGAADIVTLDSLTVNGSMITVTIKGAPSMISFVGEHNVAKQAIRDVTTSSYTMADTDPFIRVVVDSPQTQLYLNPIIRYDGTQLPHPVSVVDVGATWLQRAAIAALVIALSFLYLRRKRESPQLAASPVLADIKRNPA